MHGHTFVVITLKVLFTCRLGQRNSPDAISLFLSLSPSQQPICFHATERRVEKQPKRGVNVPCHRWGLSSRAASTPSTRRELLALASKTGSMPDNLCQITNTHTHTQTYISICTHMAVWFCFVLWKQLKHHASHILPQAHQERIFLTSEGCFFCDF